MIEELPSIKGVRWNTRMSIDPGDRGIDNAVTLRIPHWDGATITVDPTKLAAFLTEHIPGFEATYVAPPKPFELPVREGAVVDMTSRSGRTFRFVLSADGSWRATADRDYTYEHERLLVWMNNTDATPTIVSNGLGVD